MSTLHEKAIHLGDAWEATKTAVSVGLVAVAVVLLVPGVGWGAVEVTSAFTAHLDPTRAHVAQAVAGVMAGAGMAGVIFGIHRFTRRTPVVKR